MSDAAAPRLRIPRPLDYTERPEAEETAFDRWGQGAWAVVVARSDRLRARRLRAILREVRAHEATMAAIPPDGIGAAAARLRPGLRAAAASERLDARAVGPAFALVREAAGRVLGQRHYDVQLLGAFAMLRGLIAEMRTGEGKTLCATLAAASLALAGIPVHVITVNDYLAERDAEHMAPLYRALGLTLGVVKAGQGPEERRAIYACDIVHGSNKEIAFDYLRDRMALRRAPGNLRRKLGRITGHAAGGEGLRMRGLHAAIIDEADSVLIDEARTPLIISGAVAAGQGQDTALLRRAMMAAQALEEGRDYRVHHNERRIEFTDRGHDRMDDMAPDDDPGDAPGGFAVRVIREHAIMQALSALHLFHRDEAYILREGKVQIVDENTGRTMADRTWSEGLHQMIELKEGIEPTEPRETLSRITYQRMFRRYARLGGMTGTARDAAWELWSVYRLAVAKIPTNKPDARVFVADRVFATADRKWRAVAARVAALHREGVPVLLGTRSVAASEAASERLHALGLPHEVLSAAQDADEAAVVARAGQRGAIMVATNMAGRGTDIRLGPGVGDLGGLHVLLTERHDSRRVDRQLEGRCGRQGERGRVEAFLSLEDELMRSHGARLERRLARLALVLGPRAAGAFIRLRQRRIERLHGRLRHDLLEADRNLGQLLAFSGQNE